MAKRSSEPAAPPPSRGGPYPAGVLDVWGGGQLLAASGLDGPTPYHQALACRTPFQGTGLLVKYPDEADLVFSDGPPTRAFLTGDVLDLEHPDGRTRGALLDACHLLLEGPCKVRSAGAGLKVLARGNRTLVAAAGAFDPGRLDADLDRAIADRLRWITTVPRPEVPDGPPRKTLAKCLSVLKTTVYGPEGRLRRRYTTPDRWPHRGMWLWDSAFHAVGMRHLDPALARDAVEAVLDVQHPDGQVQISYFHKDERAAATQPPVLAMAAQLVHEADPRAEWVERIYPKLAAYLQWDMEHRDVDRNGLLEWQIESNVRCRCGESGWDNSPRFDIAKPLDAVDFNAFLARECEAMAAFARVLGRPDDQARWSAQRDRLCRLINERLWDEPLGLYVDAVAGTGEHRRILTAAGFLPLLCGAASKAQAARLARHLEDPKTFGTALPVATVSPSERAHYSKDMWRGPVWANINWCIVRGLERSGLGRQARRLRDLTMKAIERYYLEYGAIFEFFDDEGRVPPPRLLRKRENNPAEWIHQVIHDYGWTAALYVDLAASSPAAAT